MQKLVLVSIAFLIFCGITLAADFPQQTNFVNDFTATLSPEIVDSLNLKLKTYETETGTEIAVAIVESTDGEPIEQFTTRLGNAWGVGKAQVDNGVLFVVAKSDRELFIATGSQTEGALTDLETREIIETIILPYFRVEDFEGGISAGVEGILAGIAGESFTDLRTENGVGENVNFFQIIFFAIFFVLPWLGAVLGRSKRIWPGGAVGALGGGIGGAILFSGIWVIAGTAVGLGILGLLFDAAVSRNFANAKKSGSGIAWWAGGGRSGGGNFGSSGFGGFGGGGFSGGGFGGKW
ncbi:TPM domain-containing protein [Candidatus Gracilibacteria bacterium]|nr:TPM domain-containing protein [Candidatus Gracilibacteria bacterium]MCF7897092.1 TPM domain-containing protein [Candidatus Gracilibacteria bacterium]